MRRIPAQSSRPAFNRKSKIVNRKFFLLLLFLLLTSCSSPTPGPTLLPTVDNGLPSPVPATAPATQPATAEPPAAAASPTRAQYTMNVILDYAAKTVVVDETIVYPNGAAQPLTDLVLAVEPNLWLNCFALNSLTLDGAAVANYTLDGQRLSFPLLNVMPPGAVSTLQIEYTLTLPKLIQGDPNLIRPRIFGFSDRQINLTNWYPFVVPNMNGQWVLHDPWYYGEHLAYDSADYVVNYKPADPAVAPIVAASAPAAANGEWTSYTLSAGRTFALAASTEFITASIQVGDIAVTSYYFNNLYKGSGEAALNAAAQAIQVFSQRYGPYSHKSLAVVMGDFNDGMEFSGFFFLPFSFYNLYDGSPNGYLTAVAAHETAHQWWFEQVANDQADQPWLDESLATYSEHVFYETVSPATLTNWWWIYRIDAQNPQGWVDTPVNSTGGNPQYWGAVYFRGAHFLDDLRTRMGDEAFFAFLRDYLTQENGRIATSSDFFRILGEHTTSDYSDLIRQYFQNVYQ